ncbi:class I SAM-dependent methyltransferase, partial [Chloroflexota bacterium]
VVLVYSEGRPYKEGYVDKPMSNFGFKMMSCAFKVRDFFKPRRKVIAEVGMKPGDHVLDYGCGTGSYVKAVADIVGPEGKVHALDIHPHAIRMVQRLASKNRLDNVETILSDCKTDLLSGSIDVVLLYDTFHALTNPDETLVEMYRVLKTDGTLSFSDHHLKYDDIIYSVTVSSLFELTNRGDKTYSFKKT